MCKPITQLRLKYVSTTDLTPEYRSQDGSGTLDYHRFEDRSIILSRTTLIEVYTLSLISVFRAQVHSLKMDIFYNPKILTLTAVNSQPLCT